MWGPFEPVADAEKQGISISCPLFYDSTTPVFLRPQRAQWLTKWQFQRAAVRALEEFSESEVNVSWKEPDRAEYERAFARIQNLIQQGQIDKAVPMVFATAQGAPTEAQKLRWILSLLDVPTSLHVYGFWDGSLGVLGATPELLFDLEGLELRTMALAGTLAREDGSAVELLRSAKDQKEHRYVVDDLRDELSRLGSPVRVGETRVKELPSLLHLQTELSVTLSETPDWATLIQRLHPTPALGVFPRRYGWRWMSELPGQANRGFFGAPLTIHLGQGRVRSLVAIRNIQWQGSQLQLGSGGGVVKESQLEAEWNELFRKRQAVLRLLGMMK